MAENCTSLHIYECVRNILHTVAGAQHNIHTMNLRLAETSVKSLLKLTRIMRTVSEVTTYLLDGKVSIVGMVLCVTPASKPGLGPTEPFIQWAPGLLTASSPSVEVKSTWIFSLL